MKLRFSLIAIFFIFCFSGCSTINIKIWKDQNITYSKYNTFEIRPVINVTGTYINEDSLNFYNDNLKEQFKVRNLPLNNYPQNRNGVLIVKSLLLVYNSTINMNIPKTSLFQVHKVVKCEFLINLVDKSSSYVVAKISTVKEEGNIIGPVNTRILEESAVVIAKEVANLIQNLEPQDSILQKL
jgi:hypothetical protein